MKETYRDLLEQLKTARTGKECRELHRKLRRFGDGIALMDRYPYLPLAVSIVAFVISVVAFLTGII